MRGSRFIQDQDLRLQGWALPMFVGCIPMLGFLWNPMFGFTSKDKLVYQNHDRLANGHYINERIKGQDQDQSYSKIGFLACFDKFPGVGWGTCLVVTLCWDFPP